MTTVVDVIVPVYAGEAETRRCLTSLKEARCTTRFEIVVIDDCSPEPGLSAWLVEEEKAGTITLLRNEVNCGFVATVNRGIALHPERDVVLLNSDAEVANDWLDRLWSCAYRANNIGTVTPFSNNATICSYPFEGWMEGLPGRLGLTKLDELFARENAGLMLELPSAVGFCMFIRRACLDQIGQFDEVRFGRGYGEENDFSRRAYKAGWRNVLCADVFVFHCGGVSFGDDRAELMRKGALELLELHPDYDDIVISFLKQDPLHPLRQRVDVARARLNAQEFCSVIEERTQERALRCQEKQSIRAALPVRLHIAHDWGGGTERWVQDFCEADLSWRNLVLRGRTSDNHTAFELQLLDPQLERGPLLCWELQEPIHATALVHEEYKTILQWITGAFDVKELLVSSLIGHALDIFSLPMPITLVLHDFYPFCPALFAFFNQPCQTCGDAEVARCLESNRHNVFWHIADKDDWGRLRTAFGRCLKQENVYIVSPTLSVFERYARLFPPLAEQQWKLIPHGLGAGFLRNVPSGEALLTSISGERLRVLMPGRLLPHKGMWLLRAALDELTEFVDLILLGTGDFGAPFEDLSEVTVVREYDVSMLPDLVRHFQPDCALLASTLPESFSYTLSEMNALGIPVVATRMGAFSERIKEGETGFLVEANVEAVVACLRGLNANRERLQKVAATLRALPVRTAMQMVDEINALHEEKRKNLVASKVVEDVIESLAQLPLLRSKVRALRQEAAELQADVHAHSLLVKNREAYLAELMPAAAERDAMLASSSWRLTRPLRRLKCRLDAILGRPPSPEMSDAFQPVSQQVEKENAPEENNAVSVGIETPELTLSVHTLIQAKQAATKKEWGFELNECYRQAAQRKVKEKLGVPEAGCVIIALHDGSDAMLSCFIKLAKWVTEHRTHFSFIWVDEEKTVDMHAHLLDLGLLVETRDLFFVTDDQRPWLLGADIGINLCRDAQKKEEANPVPVISLAELGGQDVCADQSDWMIAQERLLQILDQYVASGRIQC